MVFLVFSEVPEMSSEVAGPGPTHGRSNLPELTRDLLLVQGQPAHDDNTTDQPPLLALTSCPSTTRWMLQAVLAQSFAWLARSKHLFRTMNESRYLFVQLRLMELRNRFLVARRPLKPAA